MRYKNKKTGAVVDSPFVIRGENWEEVKPVEIDYADLTVKELKDIARERDIPYGNLKKEELIEQLEE